jgi:phage terminase large subunit GpA-like protein
VTADALTDGEWYLKQVVNEPQVMERSKDGRTRVVWKERDRTVGHDFWDCEVYASAAAQMIVDGFPGGPGWDAARWPRSAGGELREQREAVAAGRVEREFD